MVSYEQAERVNSKETFQQFLLALIEDWDTSRQIEEQMPSSGFGPAANGWENVTIDAFLEAMYDWSLTTNAITDKLSVPEEASWSTFAELLVAAKTYE